MADSQLPTQSTYSGTDPDPMARIGEIVGGRYRLLEFIGQGGMGNVYRGEHTTIRKPVALKLLHPSLANIPELRTRFEREAFAIGRIEHPNCISVTDFGELGDGSLFLAMEYLDGESAADLLDRERPLAAERALLIIRYVLAGLGHAHQVGIVHRDVKPENIFILKGDANFAKILDFGIAKLIGGAEDDNGSSEKLTQGGITFGTPAYLSPEQALGDPSDARSDLYSVAVVLYELLTGVPPFRAPDKIELLAMHANRPPPPLGAGAPLTFFSPPLEAILQKGLAKRPRDRYQTAEEFIEAIDSLGLFPRPSSAADFSTGAMHHLSRTPLPISPQPPVPTIPTIPTTQGHSSTAIWRRKKWPLLAFGAAAAVVVATMLVLLSNRTRTLAEIEQSEPSEVAIEAGAKINQGDTDEAIEMLTKEPSSDTDPSAQASLGHAYASEAKYEKAVAAFAKALLLDENAIRDAEMITDLRLMVDDDGPIYFEALRLLVEYAKDDEAIARMAKLASHKRQSLRSQAFALAELTGHTDEINRVRSALFDLVQLETCEDRRKAVVKLRALGDPRAVGALETARIRRGKRGKKRVNLNRCLSAAARDAAKFLRSKPRSTE